MAYRIKRVDGNDEEIAELLRDLHDEIFGDSAPQVHPEEGWWWIAYAVDETRDIAGFCWVKPTTALPRTMAYLARAGVRLSHRGAGLQRRFVRVREALCRRLGFEQIVTDTTDNPASANNLIRCGYLTYRPQSPWGFSNTIYWMKNL